MILSESVVTTVMYKSDRTGKSSSRVIIPFTVPSDTVKAIDVDSLSPSDRANMASLVTGYLEYRNAHNAGMFKFEDWVEHTQGVRPETNWRMFKLNGLS